MSENGRTVPEYQRVIEVDGESYKLLSMSPSKAFELNVKLSKIIGGPVATLAESAGDADKAGALVPIAFEALQKNLDSKELWPLVTLLLKHCEYEKQVITDATIEVHFKGRMGHMMKVVAHCIEFQCADFFLEIANSITGLMTKAQAL